MGNKIFIKRAKEFILSLIGKCANPLQKKLQKGASTPGPTGPKNLVSDQVMKSPLRKVLTTNILGGQNPHKKNLRMGKRSPFTMGMLTSNQQTLYAFSPNVQQ